MKLVTFGYEGKESWGFVVDHPTENRLWVYEPGKVDINLQRSATTTNGYSVSMPKFMPESRWPESLVEFLALEDAGMETLQRMERFLIRFLEQSDDARLSFCGHPLEDVQLKAPVPSPRLMWGLVQNCPTFIRSNPQRQSTNLYPQGHQRPAGAVVGDGQLFVQPHGTGDLFFNVELGIVIGKKGRYIPVNKAMEYVAGYTVVIDSSINGFHKRMDKDNVGHYEIAAKMDWYVGATCSWGGKMADAHCTMGPWVTTRDEIGNPYDLLVWTKMSGKNRDRSHTAALLLGIERTIQWYSSFATLYPGDVIHLGTMGTDGLHLPEEFRFNGPEGTVDAEIEKVGYVKSPVLNTRFQDWRADDDESKTIHVSPAVRDIIKAGKGEVDESWQLKDARHFWTLFKNYRSAQQEGIHLLQTPRFLAAPNSAMGMTGSVVELPPRCHDLEVSIELAVVLKKVACKVEAKDAEEYVLGYMPMISLTDSSFDDILVEPTTYQERGLPLVYGRWADGFNSTTGKPVAMTWEQAMNRKMTLEVEGVASAEDNTSGYYASISDTLDFITAYVTMFPGDVVTMGCSGNRITVPADKIKDGMVIKGSIEGLGEVNITLKHSDAPDNSLSVNQLKL